jgi:2-oxoglutarate ferredoxin oxidoreductase subunit beta
MNTYGFHTIHGRAPAFATGIKVANPELTVWLVTGDGDGLSIGGNHLAHILRRNVDVNILLFNNQIYGLTKGQYSPTSPVGQRTKTSPMGSVDRPFNPLSFALGCNATFVARTYDTNMQHMEMTFEAAARHRGTSFVEIYQNCVIFNDACFEDIIEKSVRDDRTIDLRPGQPMVFGKQHDKGIRAAGFQLELTTPDQASIWDPTVASSGPAYTMSMMDQDPNLPNPIGIFRAVQAPTFEQGINAQNEEARKRKGPGRLEDLIRSGETWQVA